MKRDINSGHSRRKWKWLKIIFGFLGGREIYTERNQAHGSKRKKDNGTERGLGRLKYASHINLPGYKTLEHLIVLADKLNEARGCHSA